MDKYRYPSTLTEDASAPSSASVTADSLESDFEALIVIFNRHLDAFQPDDHEARRHIELARTAAERGLRLSRKLIDVMDAPE